jgi:hypothetical protein
MGRAVQNVVKRIAEGAKGVVPLDTVGDLYDINDPHLNQHLYAFKQAGGGLIVEASTLIAVNRVSNPTGATIPQIITIAHNLQLPVVYPNALYPRSGGLISVGSNIPNLYASAGAMVRNIITALQGGQQLPNQQIDLTQAGAVAKFETVINGAEATNVGVTAGTIQTLKTTWGATVI